MLVVLAACLVGNLTAHPSRAWAIEPPITALAFAPDGKSVVACSQAGLSVFAWPDLTGQKTIASTIPNLHALAFSPEGNYLAVGGGFPAEEGLIELFSWPAGESLGFFDGHDDSVLAVDWLDRTSIASAGLDHTIVLRHVETGVILNRLEGHSRGVTGLASLHSGTETTLVSAGIDQSLRVWDIQSGELVHSLVIHTRPVNTIALRPNSRGLPMVASLSEDKTVRFWQPTIGRMVRFVRLTSRPLDAAWLPDGSRLAVSNTDGRVRLINPDTVNVTDDLPALDGWAYALAVHPTEGHLLVGGRDGQLRRIER